MVRSVSSFDPLSAETIESPYAFYEALREQAPLYKPKGADCWYLSRHHDIREVAMDPVRYSSNVVAIILAGGSGRLSTFVPPRLPFAPPDVLAIQDPPKHLAQRKVVTKGLGKDFVSRLETDVHRLVDEHLDDVLARRECDWMERFAFRIPITVALDILSIPRRHAMDAKRWADDAIDLLSGVHGKWKLATKIVRGFGFVRWCRKQFETARSGALMGALHDAVADGTMTEPEAVATVLQIIIAGSDSSASLIGSMVRLLAQHPTIQEELRTHPELIPRFVEETIRLESPFQGHFRQTKEPVELHGHLTPGG